MNTGFPLSSLSPLSLTLSLTLMCPPSPPPPPHCSSLPVELGSTEKSGEQLCEQSMARFNATILPSLKLLRDACAALRRADFPWLSSRATLDCPFTLTPRRLTEVVQGKKKKTCGSSPASTSTLGLHKVSA